MILDTLCNVLITRTKWRHSVFLLCLLFFNAPAHSTEIVIAIDKDIAPYRSAIQGIKDIVKADFSILHLKEPITDLRTMLFAKGKKPRLIISVGAKSSTLLKQQISDIPILYTMLSGPERYDLIAKNVTGVKLDYNLEDQIRYFKKVMPDIKPVVGFNKWTVTAGALFCLYQDYGEIGRQTGRLAKLLLGGTPISQIPSQQPENIRVLINQKMFEKISRRRQLCLCHQMPLSG